MPKDPRDDISGSFDWDDMDDWLSDLKEELNMDTEPKKPVSTAREPGRTSEQAQPRARTPQPAAAPRRETARPGASASSRSAASRRPASGEVRRSQTQGQTRQTNRAADYEQARRGGPPRKTVSPEGDAYHYKRRRQTNVPVIILIVLLVLGMAFAAYQLGSIFLNYRRDRSAYNELAERAISSLAEEEEKSDETVSLVTPEPGQTEQTVSEVPISVDWEYLSSINSDIVGWLYCPDTVINYPVVQRNDHEYYLTHGFDGSTNSSGTLFVDMDSVEGIVQSNYIVYGHNMKDKSMFGSFQAYINEDYYESYPTLYYLTPNGNYRIDLFCAHIVESTDNNYPGYFSSTSDYQAYLNKVTASAFWVNYDVISTDYQLFTMSTCTSAAGYSDPRLLVQGMMVPIQ